MQTHYSECKQLYASPPSTAALAPASFGRAPRAAARGRLLLALALFVSVYLLVWLAAGLRAHQLERLREQRYVAALTELRERLTAELGTGPAFAASGPAQAWIEAAAAHMPEVRALELVSARGLSVLSSDRGLRGEAVSASWQSAMAKAPQGWRAIHQDECSLGLPWGDAGQQGSLVLTYRLESALPDAGNTGLVAGLIAAGLALLHGGWCARRQRVAHREELQRLDLAGSDGGAFAAAVRALLTARLTLADIEAQGRRLGDPMTEDR